jgi:hypothetical protein
MSATGTYRGTPKSRGQPPFQNSPSHIPRPASLEPHQSATGSESGHSTISASRQKQSKRDEVGAALYSLSLC